MRELFKGWRRKAGLVLLGLACAALVMWMRSTVIADSVTLDQVGVVSQQGLFSWGFIFDCDGSVQIKSKLLDGGQSDGFFPHENEVPYWSVTASFAILSAVLLLWPRRKRSG